MAIELKPCPFCGSTNIGTYGRMNYIYCQCNLCGARNKGITAEEVYDDDDFWEINEHITNRVKSNWNTRYNEKEHKSISTLQSLLDTDRRWFARKLKAIEEKIDKVLPQEELQDTTSDN